MPTTKRFERKWMLIPVVMALLLSACSLVTPLVDTRSEAQRRASQLALGTVSLEGTAVAVDAAAAARLLPMWEVLFELSTSSTAAPEELAATVKAIEAAMTADQLAAIEAMDLSAAEASSVGPAAGDEANAQVVAAPMDSTMSIEAGSEIVSGMPVDGGIPPGGSGQARASRTSTSIASSSGIYRDVIALLQSKTPS